MFERLGTITFIRKGWIMNTYSECHIYLDGTRVLLKYDDFAETYLCSEQDMQLNYVFIEQLKLCISLLNENKDTNVSLKQLISYYSTQRDKHTVMLHQFILDILPGTQLVYAYSNDPNFMYLKNHTYLICTNDYTEYFLI